MRVLVINPNSTQTMTDGIAQAARAAAASDVEVHAATNSSAPPAIQGPEDGDAAVPGVLALTQRAAQDGFDAVVIACFDDTGLAEARSNVNIPVIGIGQSAFLTAMVYGGRFTVITTLPVSVPVIEENIAAYGFTHACARVTASGLPVLTLENDPDHARMVLDECARMAASRDGASTIVLGCAGMAAFGPSMQEASNLPTVDGVAAAIGLARAARLAG